MSSISFTDCTNEAKIMSILFFTAHSVSAVWSFSVRMGRLTSMPGRLQFFVSPSLALFSHTQSTSPLSGYTSSTRRQMVPSAMRMREPASTSLASVGYESAIFFVFPTKV